MLDVLLLAEMPEANFNILQLFYGLSYCCSETVLVHLVRRHGNHEWRWRLKLSVNLQVAAATPTDADLGASAFCDLPHVAALAPDQTRHQIETRDHHVEMNVCPQPGAASSTSNCSHAWCSATRGTGCVPSLLLLRLAHSHFASCFSCPRQERVSALCLQQTISQRWSVCANWKREQAWHCGKLPRRAGPWHACVSASWPGALTNYYRASGCLVQSIRQ
mmetsp:Transcript_10804/g.20980  ORF Transcript_10804/g.20980 Transcript_10804/m.20980 type:complete len:219 (-) Transcript_10804:1299-1955(-)